MDAPLLLARHAGVQPEKYPALKAVDSSAAKMHNTGQAACWDIGRF